jgi:hypothetical protein
MVWSGALKLVWFLLLWITHPNLIPYYCKHDLGTFTKWKDAEMKYRKRPVTLMSNGALSIDVLIVHSLRWFYRGGGYVGFDIWSGG